MKFKLNWLAVISFVQPSTAFQETCLSVDTGSKLHVTSGDSQPSSAQEESPAGDREQRKPGSRIERTFWRQLC